MDKESLYVLNPFYHFRKEGDRVYLVSSLSGIKKFL